MRLRYCTSTGHGASASIAKPDDSNCTISTTEAEFNLERMIIYGELDLANRLAVWKKMCSQRK